MIRRMLSEKNLVVLVFILVLVIFSFAQEASKSLEKMLPIQNVSIEQTSPSVEKLAESETVTSEYPD